MPSHSSLLVVSEYIYCIYVREAEPLSGIFLAQPLCQSVCGRPPVGRGITFSHEGDIQ